MAGILKAQSTVHLEEWGASSKTRRAAYRYVIIEI